jgi:hypothetical protein
MFCLGRHVVRDVASCTTSAVLAPIISVGDPIETGVTPAPSAAQTAVAVTPTQTPAPTVTTTPLN